MEIIHYWIIAIIISHKYSVHCTTPDAINSVIKRLFYGHPYYQTTIFIDVKSSNNSMINKIISELPSVLIDFSVMKTRGDNRSLHLPIFDRPRDTILSILIFDNNIFHVQQLNQTLKSIVNIAPTTIRPKCLALLLNVVDSEVDGLKNILMHSWSLKYLDFSVALIYSGNHIDILSYNPFTNTFFQEQLNLTTNIFPDKLLNMHRYQISAPIFDDPPHVIVRRDDAGHPEVVEGLVTNYCRFLAKRMNFTLQLKIDLNINDDDLNRDTLFRLLAEDKVDMSMSPMLVRTVTVNDAFVISREWMKMDYVMIVPIVKQIYLLDLAVLYEYAIVTLAIVLSFFLFAYLAKLPSQDWQMLNVTQILLGMTSSSRPQIVSQRILYWALVMLSMHYTTTIFARMMNVKVREGEKTFKSLDDIYAGNLTVYMSKYFFDEVYTKNLRMIRRFKYKPKVFNDVFECLHMISRKKNVACLTTSTYGRYLIAEYKSRYDYFSDGYTMKVAEFVFHQEMIAAAFAPASPYVQRFDYIVQNMQKMGLTKNWEPIYKSNNVCAKHEMDNVFNIVTSSWFTADDCKLHMSIILVIGVPSAILTFLLELASKFAQLVYQRVAKQKKIPFYS